MKKLGSIIGLLALAFILSREMLPYVRAGVSCSVPITLTNGTTADATQVMTNFNALAACFSSVAAAGANTDITSLAGLTTPISAAQGGTQYYWAGTATGTANAVVLTTVTPTTFSFTSGSMVCWRPNATNTGPVTLNINGTGASALNRHILLPTGGVTNAALVGGELATGTLQCMVAGAGYTLISHGVDTVGEIRDFGYAGCPTGWAETNANNNTYDTTNFPSIFTAFSTTWGTNGGFTVMPDLRGRAVFGRDSGGSGRITAAGGNFDGTTVGNTGGGQNQTLTQAQLPNIAITASFSGNQLTASHIATSNGAFTGAVVTQSGGTSVPNCNGVCGDLNAPTPSGSVSVSVAGGSNALGSGNAHTILAPAGIVTKCVKL